MPAYYIYLERYRNSPHTSSDSSLPSGQSRLPSHTYLGGIQLPMLHKNSLSAQEGPFSGIKYNKY